ncbi:hypothetical protein ACMXYX_10460 [Neptuniibacter sp. QD72_48]|uniref:hypothetical protein n=1 Tax=unclassified Neptuniibacter TaxID=2630693 RepID=UPI0039F608EB
MNEPTQGRNTLPLQILIIFVIIIGLGSVIYLPQLLQETPPHTRQLLTAPECDLHQGKCLAADDNLQVELSIVAEEISSSKPLLFDVTIENIAAEQVLVDLQGKSMYMGINQTLLTKIPGTDNRWQGSITLPICTTGKMTWVSSIKIEEQGQITQANFEFDAR